MKHLTNLREKVNNWGANRTPFLLLADFELNNVQLFPLSSIDPAILRYRFHQHTNEGAFKPQYVDALKWETHFITPQQYRQAFSRVQEGLQRGDSFLTNLTFPTKITTNWSLLDVYNNTQARYQLWWKDKFAVFSPEIFVQIKDSKIYSYPMKGTLGGHLPGTMLLSN
ncbi:MAG: chorismate-binding protein, partial [Bacteroidota bacterium]